MVVAAFIAPDPGQNMEIADVNGYVPRIVIFCPTALLPAWGQIVLFVRQAVARQVIDPPVDVKVRVS